MARARHAPSSHATRRPVHKRETIRVFQFTIQTSNKEIVLPNATLLWMQHDGRDDAPREEKKSRKRQLQDNDFSDSDEGESKEPTGPFRFNARKCFLTYPRCPTKEDEFLALFPIPRDRIKTCFAKQEQHRDGTPHLHVYLVFNRKMDLTNPRCFDLLAGNGQFDETGAPIIERFHPNIKRASGPEDLHRAYEYLCKDGTRPTELTGEADLYRFSKNFCQVYRDRESWLSYRRSRAQGAPQWPIAGPRDTSFGDPKYAGKQRNLWLYGKANAGKTTWLEEKVYCYRNYKVGNTRYPFDNYTEEQIVVYDDVKPCARHLLVLGNVSNYSRPCPGDTRYHQRFIPPRLAIWTVVCTNKSIDQEFEEDSLDVREAVKARFIEVELV